MSLHRNERQRGAAKTLLLLVAVALAKDYDAIATFDQKLVRHMNTLGVEAYF